MGNTLIYRDTYEQALEELTGATPTPASAQPEAGSPPSPQASGQPVVTQASPPPASGAAADGRLQAVRDHLRRYREFSSQGRWAEAGRELEALEKLVGR